MYLYHFGPAKILKLLFRNHNEKEATEDDYPFNSYLNTFCILGRGNLLKFRVRTVFQAVRFLEAVKSESLRSNSSWNIRQRV